MKFRTTLFLVLLSVLSIARAYACGQFDASTERYVKCFNERPIEVVRVHKCPSADIRRSEDLRQQLRATTPSDPKWNTLNRQMDKLPAGC